MGGVIGGKAHMAVKDMGCVTIVMLSTVCPEHD
jgi:hypothetical protein